MERGRSRLNIRDMLLKTDCDEITLSWNETVFHEPKFLSRIFDILLCVLSTKQRMTWAVDGLILNPHSKNDECYTREK